MAITARQAKMYRLLTTIPKGMVTTYGDLARALGNGGLSRAVGHWLTVNEDPDGIPCYKVVASSGALGGYNGGLPAKIRRLKKDGITVRAGKIVDFAQRRYRF